jgi:hypothetical protein
MTNWGSRTSGESHIIKRRELIDVLVLLLLLRAHARLSQSVFEFHPSIANAVILLFFLFGIHVFEGASNALKVLLRPSPRKYKYNTYRTT